MTSLLFQGQVNQSISLSQFRIGNYFNRPGLRPLSTNSLCGSIGAWSTVRQHNIICTPNPISGKVMTVQKTTNGYWEIAELDINVV